MRGSVVSLARLRLATGPQGKRLATRIGRFLEQRRDGNLQDRGERLQPRDRDVLGTALDAADIGTVDAGIEGEPLLGVAALDAQAPQVQAEDGFCFHPSHKPDMRLDNRRTYDPILIENRGAGRAGGGGAQCRQ